MLTWLAQLHEPGANWGNPTRTQEEREEVRFRTDHNNGGEWRGIFPSEGPPPRSENRLGAAAVPPNLAIFMQKLTEYGQILRAHVF